MNKKPKPIPILMEAEDEIAALRSDLAAAEEQVQTAKQIIADTRGALGMALQGLEKLAFITGHEADRLNARQARAALAGPPSPRSCGQRERQQ
jgi:hypothetical protein